MQWLKTKITPASETPDWILDLLADVFHGCGLKGVVIDDPTPEPGVDWGPDALPPPSSAAVTGYLPMDQRLEDLRLSIENGCTALAEQHGFTFSVAFQPVDEKDWAEAWKAFFHPEKASDTLVIKPTWRRYDPQPGEQIIEIDPGMAFGTGTHPTTRLCLRLLEKHLTPDQSVLDIGTGSGILLIAAHKLGATTLTGVDTDPMAVDVARTNLIKNGIERGSFNLQCGHLAQCIAQPHQLVLANILAPVIMDLLNDVPRVLAPNGFFIASGILRTQQDQVIDKMNACGLTLIEEMIEEDWVALVGSVFFPSNLAH